MLEMAVLNGEISPDGSITVTEQTLEQRLGKKTLLYEWKSCITGRVYLCV